MREAWSVFLIDAKTLLLSKGHLLDEHAKMEGARVLVADTIGVMTNGVTGALEIRLLAKGKLTTMSYQGNYSIVWNVKEYQG